MLVITDRGAARCLQSQVSMSHQKAYFTCAYAWFWQHVGGSCYRQRLGDWDHGSCQLFGGLTWSDVRFLERILLDTYYVRNCSIWMDLQLSRSLPCSRAVGAC